MNFCNLFILYDPRSATPEDVPSGGPLDGLVVSSVSVSRIRRNTVRYEVQSLTASLDDRRFIQNLLVERRAHPVLISARSIPARCWLRKLRLEEDGEWIRAVDKILVDENGKRFTPTAWTTVPSCGGCSAIAACPTGKLIRNEKFKNNRLFARVLWIAQAKNSLEGSARTDWLQNVLAYHGIVLERAVEIFEKANGKCPICKKDFGKAGFEVDVDESGHVLSFVHKTCKVHIGWYRTLTQRGVMASVQEYLATFRKEL